MRRAIRKHWGSDENLQVSVERMLKPDDYHVLRDDRVWPAGDVLEVSAQLGVVAPTLQTIRKYGLTVREWLELLAAQGWACAVCQRRVRRFVTDHEHVPDWQKKHPTDRKRYVRGILCAYDNYASVPSCITADEAQRTVAYLEAYEERRT